MSHPNRLITREVRDIPLGRSPRVVCQIRPDLQGETTVKNTNSWPPSGRDFEIYRRLHVDGCSTREVAETTKLSQTRVCQIADKVAGYLLSVVPAKEDKTREQQLVVAEQIASLRVSFLYGGALQSWHDSQGTQTTTRKVVSATQPPVTVITTKTTPGDGRYLLLAARLAILASRLPMPSLEFYAAEADEADETDTADVGNAAADNPPIRACSAVNEESSPEAVSAAVQPNVSRLVDDVCAPTADRTTNEHLTLFTPVQQPSKQPSPPLSRQQRRARNKLLERKLGKG